MKKIVSIVLCCMMLVAALAGCGSDSTGYEKAFESFKTAQNNVDKDAMVKLVPPFLYDYYLNNRKNAAEERGIEFNEQESRESINRMFRPTILNMDAAKFDKDVDIYKDFSFDYNITGTHAASSSELKEFNRYIKANLNTKDKAQGVVVVKYKYTIKYKGEAIIGFENARGSGVCVKVGGKWYYVDGNTGGREMWINGQGLLINDSVQWIVDEMGM